MTAERLRKGLVDAGVEETVAASAAADVGDLVVEVRVIKWMLGGLVVMVAGLYAVLFQIMLRLPDRSHP